MEYMTGAARTKTAAGGVSPSADVTEITTGPTMHLVMDNAALLASSLGDTTAAAANGLYVTLKFEAPSVFNRTLHVLVCLCTS